MNDPVSHAAATGGTSAPALMGFYVLQRGCFVHVDAALAGILGYEAPAQLIGRSLWELVHPEDREKVSLRPERAQTKGQPVRLFKKDGTIFLGCFKGGNALFQGQSANMGILIDMNVFALMKTALTKYRSIINEVDDAVAEMDLKGNIIFSNTSVCRKWETLGDKTKTLNFRTYVDEPAVPAFIEGYKEVYDNDCPGKHIVYQVKLADGQRLTVEDSVSPMHDEAGAITGFRVISRNITDRIAAERHLARQRSQLQAIFRSVHDAIITVDPELRVVDANLSAKSICGMEKKRCMGRVFSSCLPACQHACLRLLKQTIESRQSVKDRRVVCGHPTRASQNVSLSCSPLLDPNGRFIGAVLVIRDITHLQQMEEELHQRHQFKNIVGKNQRMQEVFGLIQKLADLDTTVLITGESGTGKELIAKALHYGGRRASRPFISVNCSALNAGLLESELFGHVKGAFTGATRAKQGRFEAADGGTLLLDEIGDISPLIQLKLLRVLEEKSFERVGEAIARKTNVRIIACTNKDLKEKIRRGEFRQDLYYRLKVVQIPLPPLRQRVEDIPLLVDHFRARFNQRFNKRIKCISRDVLCRLTSYSWPGNVRELEHLLERSFVLCRGSEIRMEHLPVEINIGPSPDDIASNSSTDLATHQIQDLMAFLRANQWNKTRTAEVLGISRQTLYRKMKAARMV